MDVYSQTVANNLIVTGTDPGIVSIASTSATAGLSIFEYLNRFWILPNMLDEEEPMDTS
jgi:hypothetical protein